MTLHSITRSGVLLVAFALTACGGDKGTPAKSDSPAAKPAPGGVAWSTTALTPAAGGQVITVMAATQPDGLNRFTPSEIEARPGDVIRFTLKLGVHNVHFLPDSNSVSGGFPTDPSDLLQLPGQTVEVLVGNTPGRFYFQCDPHALLGMMGHVTVK